MSISPKRALLLKLLNNMEESVSDPSLKQTISNLRETVAHTAPEIIDSRWRRIYQLCVTHMNDVDNPEHDKCFHLYQNALNDYKSLM